MECVDIKLRLENGEEDTTILVQVVDTISGNQAVLSQEVDESFPFNIKDVVQNQSLSMVVAVANVGGKRV